MNLFIIIAVIVVVTVIIAIVLGHIAFSVTPKPSHRNPESIGLDYEDIFFRNPEDIVLHGWWIPNPEAAGESPFPTLILAHGWGRNGQRMLPYLEILKDLPLNFLVIEGRGHGENPPHHFITQVGMTHDLISALDWLTIRPEVDVNRIGVAGHSFGAAATIYAASLDIRISAFVADASYAHPREVIRDLMRSHKVPFIPLGWLMQQYIQIRLHKTLDSVAPVHAINKVKVPGLIIHGTNDQTVPFENSQRLVDAAGNSGKIEYLVLEGSDHSDSTEHPDFAPTIRRFISEHLVNEHSSNGG